MKSLTKEKRYDMIDAFNSTFRYMDDLLSIDNIHFEQIVHRIYPDELQLNKADAFDTEAAFSDLNFLIFNDTVSSKIHDKRDDLILLLLIFRSKFLTAKLLKQGYRYQKLRNAFSNFYCRHFELIEKYHFSLKKTYSERFF